MEYPSEEQLNKLISAYNDDYEPLDEDEGMRKSMLQIAEFEEKLRGKASMQSEPRPQKTEKSSTKPLHHFEQIRIPELPLHMKKRIAEDKLSEMEKSERKRELEVQKTPESRPESKQELQVQYITDSEAVDKKLKELVAKHKGANLALQKEQTANSQLKDQVEKLNRKVEELKKIAVGGHEQALGQKIDEQAEKIKKTEEKNASLGLRVNSLEAELAKALKALRREVGEKVDLDDILREDGNWVGRAQQIEVLKAKVQRLRAKAEGVPDKSPKM